MHMAEKQTRGFWLRWTLLMAALAGGLYFTTTGAEAETTIRTDVMIH